MAFQQHYSSMPPPAQYASANTVVVAQPMLPQMLLFRDHPTRAQCPSCCTEVLTSTRTEVGTYAWVLCFFLFFVGCMLGCCLIPFCVNGCKDVVHTCPNCRSVVGKYAKM